MPLAPLIDRVDELARLAGHADAAALGTARLVSVHGRRQVGKTFLLAHLLDRRRALGERTLFATALPGASERQQLDAFLRSVRTQLDVPFLPERFDGWDGALRFLAALTSTAPLAVALDEVPYLLGSSPTFAGHVQQLWDEVRRTSGPVRLLLLLTGSSVATMRRLGDAGGALFGRFDDEVRIDPFDLPSAALVLPGADPSAVIEAYAACGGYPHHLQSWDPHQPAAENLRRLCFTSGGLLLRNGGQLIADVPEDGGFRRTLHAIGSGADRRGAVASSAGQRVERPLDLLERATLIRQVRPVGAPDRTPGRWEPADAFLRAWYELCWADAEQIEAGLGGPIATARAGRWQRHLGWVFEEQARAHAVRLAEQGELPAGARYGRWWSTSGPQVEIDVLGVVGGRTTVIGEARWDARPLGPRVLDELKAKERAAPDPVSTPVLCTWSRGGGTDQLSGHGVRAYTPADMISPSA
ncbi:MAG: ATP-binding protein [Acidimicrobiales bacterium]